jgi:peptidyl-prolyl cis-trans isomerase B (cyclophilin B)
MLLALGVAGCGDDDEDSGSADTQSQTVATPEPEKQGGCTEVSQPDPKRDGGEKKPAELLTGDYKVTFETNCGAFTVDMDEDVGGLSAASFVHLADDGFYEDTFFHRIVPGFVIQGGDPTGTGTGGPGYTTRDAPPAGAQYPKYTVAMAKGGTEPPGTSGSQFFVMTGDGGLPPDYAIVGTVTKGTNVVDRIGKLGDATEQPTRIVVIQKTKVSPPLD